MQVIISAVNVSINSEGEIIIARDASQTSKLGPKLAKICFVLLLREGLRRNDYYQACTPNLENEAWKHPGSPKLVFRDSTRRVRNK